MKTLSINELLAPQSATRLLGWLERGEEVALQRGGRTIGRIVPEGVSKAPKTAPAARLRVDYAARAAAITGGRVIDTASLIAEGRGRY